MNIMFTETYFTRLNWLKLYSKNCQLLIFAFSAYLSLCIVACYSLTDINKERIDSAYYLLN